MSRVDGGSATSASLFPSTYVGDRTRASGADRLSLGKRKLVHSDDAGIDHGRERGGA
jgi:hypothetical protein